MVQTRLDRWLRERFVYETHIYSMRPAANPPHGVTHEELPPAPGRQYRIHYVVRRKELAEELIAHLKQEGQIFATRIVDRNAWFVPLIAPQGASATWRVIWTVVTFCTLIGIAYGAHRAWQNDTFRERVLESIEILKG